MLDFDSTTNELFIYGDFGAASMGMIDAASVVQLLRDADTSRPLTVRINSAGGSVDQAVAVYNALDRWQGTVNVVVDALAASAASYVAMVGERVTMAQGAMMMLHKPWSVFMGSADEMRRHADLLDQYEGRIAAAYQRRLQVSDAELSRILADETWYDAEQAVEAGLADAIGNQTADVVMVAAGRFRNTPKAIAYQVPAGSRTTLTKWRVRQARRRYNG